MKNKVLALGVLLISNSSGGNEVQAASLKKIQDL